MKVPEQVTEAVLVQYSLLESQGRHKDEEGSWHRRSEKASPVGIPRLLTVGRH